MFINPELVTQAYTENSWGNPLTSNSHGFTDLVTYEPGYFMTPDSEVAGAQENIQAVRMGTHRVPFVFHPNSNGGEWQFSIFRNKMIREKYLLNDSLAPNEFRNPHRAPNFHPQLPNKAAKSGLRAEAKPFKPKQHLDKLNMMPKLSEQMNEAVKKITASHNNYNEPTGEKAPSSMNNEKQLPHYTPPDGVFNAISPPQCASPASSSASSPSSAHHKDWNKNQDRHQEVHNGKLLENVRPIGSEKETGHGHGQIQSENKMRPPSDSLEETGSSKRRESSTGTSNQDPTDNPNAVLTTCQMKSIDVDPTDIHPGSSRLSTRENPDSIQVDSNRKERILASELQSGDVELFSVPRKNIPGIDHTDGSEDLKGKESPEVSQRSPKEVAAASKGINKIQNSRDCVHPDQKVMIRLLESKDKLRQDSLPHQLGTSIPALLDQPLVNHKKYTPEAPKGSPPIHTCSSGSSELTQTTAQVKKLSISNISHMKPHNAVSISKKRNKKGLTLRIPCEKGNKEQRMFEGTSSPKNGQLNDSDIISITKTKIGNPLIDSTQKSTQDLPLQQPGSPQAIQLPTNQQLATGNKIDREQIQTIELDQKVEKAGLEDGKHWGMTGTTPKDSILEIDETNKKNWEKQILKNSHFGKAKNTKPVEPVSKEDGFMLINSQGKNEEISSSNAKEGLGTNFATLEDLKWKPEIPEAEKDSFKEKLHVKRRQKGEGNLPKSSGSNKKTDLNSPRKKLGSKAYQITLEEYFEEVHCRAQKGIRKEEHLDDGQSPSLSKIPICL
ncbi:hypothetical protein PCASD_24735 [Puccinia coronata f. sp. avenae]|uniref:Uncharacterized protein n=1 Tax=Puccinia coronata f. sp. avenae TaxID=200324 RepID=A0A2N5TIQ1_9BASI|nr:hypothetical protein PCASD_24735 [Puccinia coronata f. sp. avenae]